MTSEPFHKKSGSPRRLAKAVTGRTVAAKVAPKRLLTAAEFQGLSDVPPEAEWFANVSNPRTRRAYQGDIHEFMMFVGIAGAEEVPSDNPRPRSGGS